MLALHNMGVTHMGALFRILGGCWIGIGVLNLYLQSMDGPVTVLAVSTHVQWFVLPGLLLIVIGVLIGLRRKASAEQREKDRVSNDF